MRDPQRGLGRRDALRGLAAGALACGWGGLGCSKQDELIVETAAGRSVGPEVIDADPWALLPSGALSWMSLSARELFAAQFGPQVSALLQRTLPVAVGAPFDPQRDIDSLALGVYSFSGVDIAGIARGRFDAAGLDQVAGAGAMTPARRPIVRSTYAGHLLYTADGIGLTVLSAQTLAFGHEVGIRRVLDRVQEGRVARALPSWFDELLATPNAPFALGIDFTNQALAGAASDELAFMDGLEAARYLGNFQAPGLNLAGTLSYAEPAAAERGATALQSTADSLRNYAFLMALLGMAQPLHRLDTEVAGAETRVVAEIDGAALGSLLGNAERLMALLSGG